MKKKNNVWKNLVGALPEDSQDSEKIILMAKIYEEKKIQRKSSRKKIHIRRVQRSPVQNRPTALSFTKINTVLLDLPKPKISLTSSPTALPLHPFVPATPVVLIFLKHTRFILASGWLLLLFSWPGMFSEIFIAHSLTSFMPLLKHHLIREAFLIILFKRAAPAALCVLSLLHFPSHLTICH